MPMKTMIQFSTVFMLSAALTPAFASSPTLAPLKLEATTCTLHVQTTDPKAQDIPLVMADTMIGKMLVAVHEEPGLTTRAIARGSVLDSSNNYVGFYVEIAQDNFKTIAGKADVPRMEDSIIKGNIVYDRATRSGTLIYRATKAGKDSGTVWVNCATK